MLACGKFLISNSIVAGAGVPLLSRKLHLLISKSIGDGKGAKSMDGLTYHKGRNTGKIYP